MNFLKAVKTRAMRDVFYKDDPQKKGQVDPDYWIRSVLRWYSKTFFTPLHVVHDLPLADVMQAYYEETFESMSEEELDAARHSLVETAEERAARLDTEARQGTEDDAFLEQKYMEEMERQERGRLKKAGKVDGLPTEEPQPLVAQLIEPAEIDLKFVEHDDFEAELRQVDEENAARRPPKK